MDRQSFTYNILNQISSKIPSPRVSKPRVILIFFASKEQIDKSMELLASIQNQYSLYSIFSPNAWDMLDQSQKNIASRYSTIIDKTNNVSLYDTSLEGVRIIIPSITKNSLSKISLLQCDNIALSWVLKALEQNIKVYCISLNNSIKNPNLKRIIDSNIEILRKLGMEFLSLTNMTNLLLNNTSHYTAKQTLQQNNHFSNQENTKGPRVITEGDVKSMVNNQQLIINQNDILTPLAKDLIRSKKITILKQENNSKR